MSQKTDRIFVYGTLLRGEERSLFMQDCALIGSFEIPGRLYDTGRDYPAAVVNSHHTETIHGELYHMEDPGRKISELDAVEDTESGLFRRIELSYEGFRFFCYEPGPLLADCVQEENRIRNGSWRKSSSLALKDPVGFARNFESSIEKVYKEPPGNNGDGIIYIKGGIPVLVSAPHATAHVRMNKLKRQEFYTGALSVMLHSITGCHVVYTNCQSVLDPNYYDESPFKRKLADVAHSLKLKLLIDIHGTGTEREPDIFPGVGEDKEFLLGNDCYLGQLEETANLCGIKLGGLDVFPAARQMTVTKFAARTLGVPAIQLEINRALRRPADDPTRFIKLVDFFKGFLASVI